MLSVSSLWAARDTSSRLLLIVYSAVKWSEVTAATSIFPSPTFSAPFFSRRRRNKERRRRRRGDVRLGGRVDGGGGGGERN